MTKKLIKYFLLAGALALIAAILGLYYHSRSGSLFKEADPQTSSIPINIFGPTKQGCSLTIMGGPLDYVSEIHVESEQGNLERVNEILNEDSSLVNSYDPCREDTPLHGAVGAAKAGMVKLLIFRGADVNAKNKNGETPLHFVAGYGCWYTHHGCSSTELYEQLPGRRITESLLRAGADIDARGYKGNTPLHVAVHCGYFPVIELLVENGADVNAINEQGQSILFAALSPHFCYRDSTSRIIEILDKKGLLEE